MFHQIAEHSYYFPCEHYSDRPTIGYIAGTQGALLFEAGSSKRHADQLRAALKEAGLPLPDFVAVSHWHWDHSFGLHAWTDAITIAGMQTNEILRKVSRWSWDDAAMLRRVASGEDIQFCHDMIKREYPDRSDVHVCCARMTFTDCLTLDLGGVVCRLIHARGPHAEDSVICHVPEDDFLFLGDSNGKDLYGDPWHFDIAHEDELVSTLMKIPYHRETLIPYRNLLQQLSFSNCIGGHAGPMTREELFASLTLGDEGRK